MQKYHYILYFSLILSVDSFFVFDGYAAWDLFVPNSMCSSKLTILHGQASLIDYYKHSLF